ncbi:UNVERIFIED_CONTAM: hypothetical protein GTU68_004987 [Idotea baltica]|nr:hypothetical protein [Idotea baltica]
MGEIKKATLNQALVLKALAFAAEKHRFQFRKGEEQTPFINHPIKVANLLTEVGLITDSATICGAILHDTIEDTITSCDELKNLFGNEICSLVSEVSDDSLMKPAECKEHQVDYAAMLSEKAKLIRLADKIANVYDIAHFPPAHWNKQRRKEYLVWSKKVVDQIRGVNVLLDKKFDDVYFEARKVLSLV